MAAISSASDLVKMNLLTTNQRPIPQDASLEHPVRVRIRGIVQQLCKIPDARIPDQPHVLESHDGAVV
jgi:hypothetical protein